MDSFPKKYNDPEFVCTSSSTVWKPEGNWDEVTFEKTSGIVTCTHRSAFGQFFSRVPCNSSRNVAKFNPLTSSQIHTPTAVHEGLGGEAGEWMEPFPGVFFISCSIL